MTFHYIDEEPVVRLELRSTNGEWLEFHAYVDSGAFYSVFHADYIKVLGLKLENGRYYANGGRLFYIVGEGTTAIEAREKAYEAMSLVSIDGNNLHFRTDIGWRDVQRLRRV